MTTNKYLLNRSLHPWPDTVNPYRMAYWDVKSRLRWDMHPLSWKSRRKLRALKDGHLGQKAVIVCNGPSLLQTDLSLLAPLFTIGLNKINLLFDKNPYRPSCIVSVNPLVIEQNAAFFNETDIPLFIDSKASNRIQFRDNVSFIHTLLPRYVSADCSVSVTQGFTVTCVAMQIAFHMGFRTLGLIGCDHNFSASGSPNSLGKAEGPDVNHFDPNYFSGGVNWHLPDLEGSEYYYHKCKELFLAAGGHIFNCTIGGKLELFPRCDLREFVQPSFLTHA